MTALSLTGTEPSRAPDNQIPESPEVVDLVDRCVAARDPAAFGALYDRFLDRVYRYLYYRVGNRPDAEDLAEQVFTKAWDAIPRFRWQGKPFLAWLYRLAHNVLVDHVRTHKPVISLDNDDRPIEIASDASTRELERQLDADLLGRAISQLTADQQQVIVLRFIEGYDSVQIARIMDKREGAIRALQLRALLRLRRVLDKQGEVGLT